MLTIRKYILCLIIAVTGSVAHAGENLALIIVNRDYKNIPGASGAFNVTEAIQELNAAGFKTKIIRNLNRNGLIKLAPTIRKSIDESDRVLVFIGGQVVSNQRESWLLTSDYRIGDGLLVGLVGLPLQTVMDFMGDKAGGAVLMVGYPTPTRTFAAGTKTGFFPVNIPQGVSVYTGRASELAVVLKEQLLVPGMTFAEVANSAPDSVKAYGFISPVVSFLPATAVPSLPSYDSEIDELEQLIWDNAWASGTENGIETYLRRYPNGRFAAQASEMLAELRRSPIDLARDVEEALALNRDTRREIQRNLSLLGFDTRGVDGIFGRGTRAAVVAWQQRSGIVKTGYLSGNQIAALGAEAAIRAEQLAEEARIRRVEQDRLDATFWRSTGRKGGEAQLRAYLKRYPDGLYSDIALERLDVFEAARRRNAAVAEGNAWDVTRDRNTLAAYRDFLGKYPNGTFSDIARERVAKLSSNQSNNAAKQEEQRVLKNLITRVLVEQQLAAIGMKPGKIDGKYDDATRKAIRRFQRAADLPVSGYVTQATIVRLLAAR